VAFDGEAFGGLGLVGGLAGGSAAAGALPLLSLVRKEAWDDLRTCTRILLDGLLDGLVLGLDDGLVADLLVGLHGVDLVVLHCGCVCEKEQGRDSVLRKKGLTSQ